MHLKILRLGADTGIHTRAPKHSLLELRNLLEWGVPKNGN